MKPEETTLAKIGEDVANAVTPRGFPDTESKYPSDEAARISVRLEADVEEAFKNSVKENHRSQSAEINFILKKHYNL